MESASIDTLKTTVIMYYGAHVISSFYFCVGLYVRVIFRHVWMVVTW